ncbi:MAG: amidohydrolase [Alphaproteobacteria bacterium]
MIRRLALFTALVLALTGCSAEEPPTAPPAAPDLIFLGGDIVTVDPETAGAEAVAVRNGLILSVGAADELRALADDDTQIIDLAGGTLLPAFIDAHGHLTMVASTEAMVNLASPPVGSINSMSDLQAALAERRDAQPEGWIVGNGYDDSLLAEGRHPTREDLDAISTDRPIALLHVSAHLGAANSRALELAGIGPDTPDPQGGHIRRIAGTTEPNGVLEESAMFQVFAELPPPSPEQQLAQLRNAQQTYARHGITTAQDGFTQPASLAMLQAAAERDGLIIDVIAYPGAGSAVEIIGDTPVGTYRNRLKIGGVKMMLDGSPQGKTAYLSAPYHVPPENQTKDYRGYPAMPDDAVDAQVDQFYGLGWPIIAHANGDSAAEQLINAVEKAGAARPGSDRRTVMIHAQTVRDDQLDRMGPLGMIPSFFVAHTFYWGDWHRDSVLGPERAYRISPAASAGRKGVTYTFHNDAPVVPPDVTRLIWSGVTRRSRSGDIIGPAERVSPMEAIKAVTINAAYQAFEEDEKGSITPGKRADLVILSENPLRVDPIAIKDIDVVQTFKDGESIHQHTAP